MNNIMFGKLFAFAALIVTVNISPSLSFSGLNANLIIRHSSTASVRGLSRVSFTMESVSVGGSSSQPSKRPEERKKSFTIAPTSESGSNEMMILDNFNQIQLGNRKKIGIIGTKSLGEKHQQMVELLSYALVLSGNHVYTSGGGNGTNLAVIKGALRACNPDLLTVILPQSLDQQPEEMQQLLARVANIVEQPDNDGMSLKEAANLCNMRIIRSVDRIVCFAYHKSATLLTSINEVEEVLEVIKFYLD